MSNALRAQIETFAAMFAADVLKAIRGASLEDILSESGGTARSPRAAAGHAAADQPAKRGPGRPRKAARAPTAPKPAAKGKGGRLARRSPADIARALASVVALVKKTPNLRAEAIRAELKMDRKEMPRVLAEGLAKKVLAKKGEKRATTYRAV
jgi:hypothetical protein